MWIDPCNICCSAAKNTFFERIFTIGYRYIYVPREFHIYQFHLILGKKWNIIFHAHIKRVFIKRKETTRVKKYLISEFFFAWIDDHRTPHFFRWNFIIFNKQKTLFPLIKIHTFSSFSSKTWYSYHVSMSM